MCGLSLSAKIVDTFLCGFSKWIYQWKYPKKNKKSKDFLAKKLRPTGIVCTHYDFVQLNSRIFFVMLVYAISTLLSNIYFKRK